MKKLSIFLAVLCLVAAAVADIDFVGLPADGSARGIALGGRVVAVQGFDAFTVQRIDSLYTNAQVVTTSATTNWTYSLSYTNATVSGSVTNYVVLTNTVDVDMAPLPADLRYIAYWTNTVVTTTAATNWTQVLAACATNTLGSATVSGGRSQGIVTNAWLAPGTAVRRASAGSPGAVLVIER